MTKTSITPQDFCDLMNELVKLDSKFVWNLIEARQECNLAVTRHSSVQSAVKYDQREIPWYQVGLLGIINGAFGAFDGGVKRGQGPIMMKINKKDPEKHTSEIFFEVQKNV